MALQKFVLALLVLTIVPVRCQEDGFPPEPPPIENEDAYIQPPQMSEEEISRQQVIDTERNNRDQIGINYEHIRSYSFTLKHTEEFILAVDFDHKIRGSANVYLEIDNSYIEMGSQEGEQTRLIIIEDLKTVLLNKEFYHTTGFEVETKKGHEYTFRFIKQGSNKMIILYMENFIAEGRTNYVMLVDVATDHQRRTNEVKNKLTTFLGYTEQTALMNDRITQVVRAHTQMYMHYQVIETILVLAITFSQVYFIRRLLTKNSVV